MPSAKKLLIAVAAPAKGMAHQLRRNDMQLSIKLLLWARSEQLRKMILPRSNVNWASRVRAAYVEDDMLTRGYTNRQALTDYFGTEKSLGSMDITAYGKRTPIRKAKAGEIMPDGTVVVGYKLGGALLWMPGDGWEGVTGSTEQRRAAWALMPHSVEGGYREWLAAVMAAYVADCYGNDPAGYFGITEKEACGIGHAERDAERAKIWECFG